MWEQENPRCIAGRDNRRRGEIRGDVRGDERGEARGELRTLGLWEAVVAVTAFIELRLRCLCWV